MTLVRYYVNLYRAFARFWRFLWIWVMMNGLHVDNSRRLRRSPDSFMPAFLLYWMAYQRKNQHPIILSAIPLDAPGPTHHCPVAARTCLVYSQSLDDSIPRTSAHCGDSIYVSPCFIRRHYDAYAANFISLLGCASQAFRLIHCGHWE